MVFGVFIYLIFFVWDDGFDAGLYQRLHPPMIFPNLIPGIDLLEMIKFVGYAVTDVAPVANLLFCKEWRILTPFVFKCEIGVQFGRFSKSFSGPHLHFQLHHLVIFQFRNWGFWKILRAAVDARTW